MALSSFNSWVLRRRRNWLILSMVIFGLPFYLLIASLREEDVALWIRFLDIFMAAGSALAWGFGMWAAIVQPRSAAIRKALERKSENPLA